MTYGSRLVWLPPTFTVLIDGLSLRLQDEDVCIRCVAGTKEVVTSRKVSTPVEGPVLDLRSKYYDMSALHVGSLHCGKHTV